MSCTRALGETRLRASPRMRPPCHLSDSGAALTSMLSASLPRCGCVGSQRNDPRSFVASCWPSLVCLNCLPCERLRSPTAFVFVAHESSRARAVDRRSGRSPGMAGIGLRPRSRTGALGHVQRSFSTEQPACCAALSDTRSTMGILTGGRRASLRPPSGRGVPREAVPAGSAFKVSTASALRSNWLACRWFASGRPRRLARIDCVFTALLGGPIRLNNWRRWVFNPACEAAGIVGATPHDLRHTAASLAVAAGANVKAVH